MGARPMAVCFRAATRGARFATASLALAAGAAGAQAPHVRITVTDTHAHPVPFALVALGAGVQKVADDSGRVLLLTEPADSLRLHVRRMGFAPFLGWVTRDATGDVYRVALQPVSVALDTVAVRARRNTALARSGFYDRVERVQRGAYAARMITPEELDLRQPLRVTQMLAGESMVRLIPFSGPRVIVGGRGPDCAMTILLDGMRVRGTLEELKDRSMRPPDARTLMSIDELISASGVAAIEIYGSSISAPAELLRAAGMASCGIVAIWTGARK
ncbi:MAG: hypothetical protein P3B98_03935 [Gemmatimonadota bacterium]|nr:hypothetical protein [Gemmatimonadota bacterium]